MKIIEHLKNIFLCILLGGFLILTGFIIYGAITAKCRNLWLPCVFVTNKETGEEKQITYKETAKLWLKSKKEEIKKEIKKDIKDILKEEK